MYQTVKKTKTDEWRLPFVNLIVRAEIRHHAIRFDLVDYNSKRNWVIGFWEEGKWLFFEYKDDKKADLAKRILIILVRRYTARISRLQKLSVNNK